MPEETGVSSVLDKIRAGSAGALTGRCSGLLSQELGSSSSDLCPGEHHVAHLCHQSAHLDWHQLSFVGSSIQLFGLEDKPRSMGGGASQYYDMTAPVMHLITKKKIRPVGTGSPLSGQTAWKGTRPQRGQ